MTKLYDKLRLTQLVKKSVSIPYSAVSFSTSVPAENLWNLEIQVSQLEITPKGSVTAYASCLLDESAAYSNGYRAAGSRNARTAITKLTFSGVTPATKGTSATVNIDDDYALKTGKGYCNQLKIYGYSVAF